MAEPTPISAPVSARPQDEAESSVQAVVAPGPGLSPEAVLEQAGATYGIGTPTECRLLNVALNDTYLLTTEDRPYIVRLYGPGRRSEGEIRFELGLVVHLAGKGIPVSAPVPDRDNRLFRYVATFRGDCALALFTYAEGLCCPWDERQSYLGGRLAAAIHGASEDFSSPHARLCTDLDYLLERPLAALERLLPHCPEDWDYLRGLGARLRAWAETAADDLDWGPCHGDFRPKNVHIAGGENMTVFDFDMCGLGWRAWDLLWVNHQPRLIGDRFLQGYTERRALGAADLAALPYLEAIRRLWRSVKKAQLAARRGEPIGAGLHQAVTFFRAWEEEPNRRNERLGL